MKKGRPIKGYKVFYSNINDIFRITSVVFVH